MNLLIADDEELTREGLLSSIDWAALGINNIYQADDGIHGLALARKFEPEIILTDVRMPRLDGIEMAKQIKEFLPESNIIFMSGYSDKEYLKAAIKLKAISYVEKPIDLEEVQEALKEAVKNHASSEEARQSQNKHYHENLGKLALKISYAMNENLEITYQKQLASFGFHIKPTTSFTTLILKMHTSLSEISDERLHMFEEFTTGIVESFGFQFIFGNKQDEYFILHLFTNDKIRPNAFKLLSESLAERVMAICPFAMAIGKTVTGIDKVFSSYNSAVILLQSTFFFPQNCILYYGMTTANSISQIPDFIPSFMELLTSRQETDALQLLNQIHDTFQGNLNLLANQAKDVYYKLFNCLAEAARKEHVSIRDLEGHLVTTLDYISGSNHFQELHEMLTQRVIQYFKILQESEPENSTVFLIKDFISKNYADDSLSVKDISEHVFLSSSYVCTIFKTETGQTLNQYLTEYRIEKAKYLLEDSRYKISDISSKVGYSDGNYFGKTFRKIVGLSPSEYREKNIR